MALHRAPGSTRRSSSPPTPDSPPSAMTLPQWLSPENLTAAVLPPGRIKLLTMALTCMIMGWSITTMISHGRSGVRQPDTVQTGLTSSTGQAYHDSYTTSNTIPTITGALGVLHKAVVDKIGWKRPVDETVPFAVTREYVYDGQTEIERLGARTRIGKCTILYNGNDLWERAIKTHENHDRIHGYRLHVLRQHLLDDVWSKPAYVLSLILRELTKPESDRLQWLLWIDADTVLLNPKIPIETFLPPPGDFEHVHLLYSNDWNGLNNGVFPIRVSKWSVELLTAILAYRYFRPDDPLLFRDQSAMDHIMKESKFVSNIVQLPQRWFNAYQGEHNETLAPYQIRRGDLLVHFPGLVDRDARMAFWLNRAEQHTEDWEVPYKSTSYPDEVREFWSQQRAIKESRKQELVRMRLDATQLLQQVNKLIDEVGQLLPGDRLDRVKEVQSSMSKFLDNADKSEDLTGLTMLKDELNNSLLALEEAKKNDRKSLISTAHDAIFAAEKELLAAGYYNGVVNPEAAELDRAVKQVKELMLNMEAWDKIQVTAAVDRLENARLKHKDRLLELELAAKNQSDQDKVNTLPHPDEDHSSPD